MKAIIAFIFTVLSTLNVSAQTPKYTITERNNTTWIQIEAEPVNSNLLDILFVIDDSGSMNDYQSHLLQTIPAITQHIVQQKISTHVGVVTTTVGYNSGGSFLAYPTNGQFISGVLDSTQPQFQSQLEKFLKPGTNGDPTEKPFEAIANALSTTALSTSNSGFLRDNADLMIVILTDTNDQSPTSGLQLSEYLKNLKAPRKVSTLAIAIPVGNPNKCNSQVKTEGAINIVDFVNLTGGAVIDLCSSDWVTPITNLIQPSFNFNDHIQLVVPEKMQIDYSSLTVKIGDTALVAGDLQNGWSFNSASNEVILSQGAIIKASYGEALTVSYKVN